MRSSYDGINSTCIFVSDDGLFHLPHLPHHTRDAQEASDPNNTFELFTLSNAVLSVALPHRIP
jgi:hypothetical protein